LPRAPAVPGATPGGGPGGAAVTPLVWFSLSSWRLTGAVCCGSTLYSLTVLDDWFSVAVTLTRTWSPRLGASSCIALAVRSRSIDWRSSSCSSPSGSSPGALGLLSGFRLPSTIETSSGRMPPPTDADTRFAMPVTAPGGSVRPFLNHSVTDAVGGRDAPNTSSLPGAMCTRTFETPSICDSVRAISPSRACRMRFCSIVFVMLNGFWFSTSSPGCWPTSTTPSTLNWSFSSSTRLAGTRTCPALSS
jgi:hypothetical protein